MKYLNTFIFIGLVAIGIIALINRGCNANNEQKTDTIYEYRFQIDTVVLKETSYVPKYSVVRDTVIIENRQIDTVEVVKEFFLMKVYLDTLSDSTFQLVLVDTITENSIKSRSYTAKVYQKTETITKTVPSYPSYISAGAFLTTGETPGISPILLYTKNKHTVGVGYDLLNKGISVNYSYKLKILNNGKKNRE